MTPSASLRIIILSAALLTSSAVVWHRFDQRQAESLQKSSRQRTALLILALEHQRSLASGDDRPTVSTTLEQWLAENPGHPLHAEAQGIVTDVTPSPVRDWHPWSGAHLRESCASLARAAASL